MKLFPDTWKHERKKNQSSSFQSAPHNWMKSFISAKGWNASAAIEQARRYNSAIQTVITELINEECTLELCMEKDRETFKQGERWGWTGYITASRGIANAVNVWIMRAFRRQPWFAIQLCRLVHWKEREGMGKMISVAFKRCTNEPFLRIFQLLFLYADLFNPPQGRIIMVHYLHENSRDHHNFLQ